MDRAECDCRLPARAAIFNKVVHTLGPCAEMLRASEDVYDAVCASPDAAADRHAHNDVANFGFWGLRAAAALEPLRNGLILDFELACLTETADGVRGAWWDELLGLLAARVPGGLRAPPRAFTSAIEIHLDSL